MIVVYWIFNEIFGACIYLFNLIYKLNCLFDYVFKGVVCYYLFYVK